MSRVFDISSGVLVNGDQEPIVDSIFAIRQLCYLFAKIELPCSDARVAHAMKGYVDCEQELSEKIGTISSEDLSAFARISSLVFRGIFSIMDSKIRDGEPKGKHGPGATADGLRGNAKFNQLEWTERLERVFPARENLVPISDWRYNRQLDLIQLLEPEAERPTKVISVPKTLKTPRIIAVEPTCMQYMQQALLEPLIEVTERQFPSPIDEENLAQGLVGFSDQHPNRDMARQGSIQGDLATLDLSEASDRVLNELVLTILHRNPLFSEAVQACRSTSARVVVKGEEIILPLRKFASMGSALCFPFEAFVFLTIVLFGIEKQRKTPLTRGFIKKLQGSVRVYGDDIIVPVEYVNDVIASLELFGLKVNGNKSFWTGKFRESCGGDFYNGYDVTPVKVRREFPKSRRDVQEVISLVAFRNLMYQRGLWMTAKWLDEKIARVLPRFPIVEPSSPILGRESACFTYHGEARFHPDLHRPVVKGFVVRSRPPVSKLDGEGALMKFFLKRGDEPIFSKDHLERSGRPDAVAINIRWMTPF